MLANDRDEFYVFNDEANGGYVVVSGDERMPDVLGYSYTGHFDAETIPCNMRAWLEDYANQVVYLRSHPEVPASRRAPKERKEIRPLLKCHFGQNKYYNEKCPIVDGEHCPTGCVATAMAQVMYYYQWPKQTTKTIPAYTTDTRKIKMPAIPVTTIDWDNMLEKYHRSEDYSEEQIDAISTLMLLCGVSVKMDYDSYGSAAGLEAACLRKYFDYDDFVELIVRAKWELDEWEQILYDELDDGRPVLYCGFPKEGIGHAFVMDGYKDGYFHVNWGMVDASDYYFLLTDLGGLNYGQTAIVGIQPANPDNPSRYAVLDNGKITLYYDKEMSHRTGTVLPHKDDWLDYKNQVTVCVIDPSFANILPRNLSEFFAGWSQLKSIEGIENLNTSMTRDMGGMFYACSRLTNLDVSGFKTDNVTNMAAMFRGCSGLTNLDLSTFKTDNVTNVRLMFEGCSGLRNLDLSTFKTDNVTDMAAMFSDCSGLTKLDVSGFKTDNVTDMYDMFRGCSGLTRLDLSTFKTDNVTDMSGMFYECSNLKTIYASERWDLSNIQDAKNMFTNCYRIVGGAGTTYKEKYSENYNPIVKPTTGSIIADADWTGGFDGDYPYWYQFDDSQTNGSVTSNPDGIAITVDKNVGMYWEPQVMVIPDGGFNLKQDGYYKVVVTAKFPTNGILQINMGTWDNYDQTTVDVVSTGDFQEVEVIFPNFVSNIDDCHLLFQCGDFTGTTILKKIQVWKMDTETTVENTGSVIADADWTGGFDGDYPYWYQFDDSQTNGSVTSNPDGIAITVDKNVGMYWEPQVMVIPDGSFDLEQMGTYKVIVTAKFPTNGTLQINMGTWDHYEQNTVDVISTGDFQKVEVIIPDYAIDVIGCHLLFQCGDFKGTTIVKKIQVLKMDNSSIVNHTDRYYARIDGGPDNPGYFTYKAPKYFTITYMIDGEPYITEYVECGVEIQTPNPPAREGYDFEWSDVPETMPNRDITIYGSYTSGIKELLEEKHPVIIFSLEGRAQNKLQKGINIIRYSDGSVGKVMVK